MEETETGNKAGQTEEVLKHLSEGFHHPVRMPHAPVLTRRPRSSLNSSVLTWNIRSMKISQPFHENL